VLIRCNPLRYKAGLLIPGEEAVQHPQEVIGQGDRLKGRERFFFSRGQYGEGSQKSKEFGRFPSGDLDRDMPGTISVYQQLPNEHVTSLPVVR